MKYIFVAAFLFIQITSFSQSKNKILYSPDLKTSFSLKTAAGSAYYAVSFQGKELISWSALGLALLTDSNFSKNLVQGKAITRHVDDEYTLVVGKTSAVKTSYNEAIYPFSRKGSSEILFNVIARVYNDGVAFRYDIPVSGNKASYQITDELSGFNLTGNPSVKALHFANTHNSHEGIYQDVLYKKLPSKMLLDIPALVSFEDCYMSITEASLHDYSGMYLKYFNGNLHTYLSPREDEPTIKVKANLPHKSPWRVMMISDNAGDFIKSNLLTSLNEPPAQKDWSWLKPGKTAFHWWNGDVIPDTNFAPGLNLKSIKYYIDFCADNHIEYNSVIGYGGFAWYTSNGPSYADAGDQADLTKPASGLDMQKVCDYAKKKGVGIHVWVNWKALYPQLEEAFTQFEKWGIKGMMVDFLDRDDQGMVNIQEEILKSAAAHHLFIQFHGAYKATGMNRTYPNELTREGTHNYEQNKWSKEPISAGHDLNIVFTRLLGGATDYHLGGFRAVTKNNFKTHYVKPLMGGTRAHMLGMYVVLESYLNMVADYPDAYLGEPGFDFLQKVPTVWDQTEVPAAAVDKYAIVARRKGNDWYMGGINNDEKRELDITFDFLAPGKVYELKLYGDAENITEDPNQLSIKTIPVKKGEKLKLSLAAGGGMAAIVQLK